MEKYMDQYCYTITMVTPVGKRNGSLVLNISQEDIFGYLDILNHKNPLSGKILKHGHCKLTGSLISLMRKSKYTAVGTFNSHSIQLTLNEAKNSYQLYGTAKNRRLEL